MLSRGPVIITVRRLRLCATGSWFVRWWRGTVRTVFVLQDFSALKELITYLYGLSQCLASVNIFPKEDVRECVMEAEG